GLAAQRMLLPPALPARNRGVPGGNAGLAGNLTWPLRQLSPRPRTPPRRRCVSGRQFAETSTGTGTHSFTASPARTPSSTVFGNPDYFFQEPEGPTSLSPRSYGPRGRGSVICEPWQSKKVRHA